MTRCNRRTSARVSWRVSFIGDCAVNNGQIPIEFSIFCWGDYSRLDEHNWWINFDCWTKFSLYYHVHDVVVWWWFGVKYDSLYSNDSSESFSFLFIFHHLISMLLSVFSESLKISHRRRERVKIDMTKKKKFFCSFSSSSLRQTKNYLREGKCSPKVSMVTVSAVNSTRQLQENKDFPFVWIVCINFMSCGRAYWNWIKTSVCRRESSPRFPMASNLIRVDFQLFGIIVMGFQICISTHSTSHSIHPMWGRDAKAS